jgi:hypothetical protein
VKQPVHPITVNLIFSLHALAAQEMPQLQNHLRRHAAKKPAIHASHSKTNPSNSQTADKPDHSDAVTSIVQLFDMCTEYAG